jgi:uncharacterized membrane protein
MTLFPAAGTCEYSVIGLVIMHTSSSVSAPQREGVAALRTAVEPSRRVRLESIDLVRGAIMVLMALDHTRDFFGLPGDPTNLATASVPLFFTRWITHFCAPGFFFLMGTGAFLAGRRRSPGELSRFLVTRGLWLIFLDLVVLRCLSYQFNADYRVTMLLVLWALGGALIALAVVIRLPTGVIAAIGGVMIAGHNLLDGVRSASPAWRILHAPGVVFASSGHVVFAAYVLVPWMGVTMVGYAIGTVYSWPPERRESLLVRLGLLLTAAFFVVRGLNVYGDPAPWTGQRTPLFTALSFLNTTKYPPSLSFLLMTLGPLIVALAFAERRSARALVVYGRVPLFYFCIHFFVLHALAVVVCLQRYGSAHWMFESPDLAHYPYSAPPGWGLPLPIVYLVWVSVVVAVYPLCRWFAGVKARSTAAWVSYL